MTHHFKIKTWSCELELCTYQQDFNPNNLRQMQKIFPNTPLGKCSACWQSQSHATDVNNPVRLNSNMILETDINKKINVKIISNEEIDNLTTETLKELKMTKKELKAQSLSDTKKVKLLQ